MAGRIPGTSGLPPLAKLDVDGIVTQSLSKIVELLNAAAPILKQIGAAVTATTPALVPLTTGVVALGTAATATGSQVQPLTEAVTALGKRMTETSANGVGPAVRSIMSAFKGMNSAMLGAAGAALGLGQTMLSFIAKANPAAAQRFTLALTDAAAVIGAILVPVFELLTSALRVVADSMTLLIPIGAEIAAALQPVIALLAEALAKYVGFLAQVLKAVVPVFGVLIRVMMDVANVVGKLIKQFLEFLGLNLDIPEAKKGASVGMAARGAQIGAVEEVLKRAMASSFSTGLAADDPASKTASAVAGIRETTDRLYRYISEQLPRDIRSWIVDDLPAALRNVASQAAGTATVKAVNAVGVDNPVVTTAMTQAYIGLQTLRYLDKHTVNTGIFD